MKNSEKKINPRVAWNNEAQDFTPWLGNNLNQLGEVVGLRLGTFEREKPVGNLRSDLVVCLTETGGRVVIENQYGKSDHAHLGKGITYATNLGIDTVIWLAHEFRPEHIRAVNAIAETGFLHMYAVTFVMRPEGTTFTIEFTVVAGSGSAVVLAETKITTRQQKEQECIDAEELERRTYAYIIAYLNERSPERRTAQQIMFYLREQQIPIWYNDTRLACIRLERAGHIVHVGSSYYCAKSVTE